MKSISIILLLTFFQLTILWAQRIPSTLKMMKEINASLKQKEEGRYRIQMTHKSISSYDTTFLEAEVYYWRSRTRMDSIGDFIICKDGLIEVAFQHDTLYMVDHDEKNLNIQYTGINGILNYLEGSYNKNLLFMPFVMKRDEPIKPYFFENSVINDTSINNRRHYLLTKTDSFSISAEQKINEDDPDTGAYRTQALFSADMTELIAIETWIYMTNIPQYQRFEFSPIRPLSPVEKFSNMFQADTLMQKGYAVSTEDILNAEDGRDEIPSLTANILTANCTFMSLDGDTVLFSELPGELLLLDYWYLSCFPCRKSMPTLYKLHETFHSKGLRIYGINPYDKTEHIKRFQAEKKPPYELLTGGMECRDQFGIRGYPTFVLLDSKNKKVLYHLNGFRETLYEELSVIIEEALANKN